MIDVGESAGKRICGVGILGFCHARQVPDYYVSVTIFRLSEVIIYLWREWVPEPAQLLDNLPCKPWMEVDVVGGIIGWIVAYDVVLRILMMLKQFLKCKEKVIFMMMMMMMMVKV